LSLPDVLGPYDDTGRFWAYVEWIANSEEFPVELVNLILKKFLKIKSQKKMLKSR